MKNMLLYRRKVKEMNKFFIFLTTLLLIPIAQAHVDWNIGINLGNPMHLYSPYPYSYSNGIYVTSHPCYYRPIRDRYRRPPEPPREMDRRMPPMQDFKGGRGPRF